MKKMMHGMFVIMSLFLAPAVLAGDLSQLLPEKLIDAEGNEIELAELEGKLVGLYFSAEWCPPCRAFTPGLVAFREKNADAFQVVFISADRSQEDMENYMANFKMNFFAVPFASPARQNLVNMFGRNGRMPLPTLVIVDSNGNVVTRDGRVDLVREGDDALAKWQAEADG